MSKTGERIQGKPGGPIPYGYGKSAAKVSRFVHPLDSLKNRNYVVTGMTVTSAGVAVGSVTVDIFETVSDIWRGRTISDASTGIYSVNVNAPDTGLTFYGRGDIAGSPERAGTTVEVMTVTEL